MDHVSRITYHVSRITDHGSRITDHVSRITDHGSRITNPPIFLRKLPANHLKNTAIPGIHRVRLGPPGNNRPLGWPFVSPGEVFETWMKKQRFLQKV